MSFSDEICWCGSVRSTAFNSDYLRCESCQTLRRRADRRPAGEASVLAGLLERSRADFANRNVFWINHLLRFRLPPGNALDLAAGPGGFAFLMEQAGFDASGVDRSQAVCDLAKHSFGIPMLCGGVEQLALPPHCFDVIAMPDVLQSLADPLGVLRRCAELLKRDGVLMIHTPKYPAPRSFSELAATQDRFLHALNDPRNLLLFPRNGVNNLLTAAGVLHAEHIPAADGGQDMFLIASPSPLRPVSASDRDAWLDQTPRRRMVRALLDSEDRYRSLLGKYRELRRGLNEETLYAAA